MTIKTNNEALEQIISVLTEHAHLIVWSPGSPDPDFLAAAEVLRQMGLGHNCRIDILGAKPLSLDVNRRLVNDFSIPYRVIRTHDLAGVEGVIVVDYPKATSPPATPNLPIVLHIDHHQPSLENGEAGIRIIDQEVGAVSTLVGEWLMACSDENWCRETLMRCATLLYYAIQVDTDALLHASQRDRSVSEQLRPLSEEMWLKKNLRLRLNATQRDRLKWGIDRAIENEGVLLCGLGLLSATERDLIAISADLLIKRKGIELSAVFALIRTKDYLTLDVSLRSHSNRIDLHDLIQRITSEGGARPFKGAYQINMDYFLPLAESEGLWQLVEDSTRHQIALAMKPESRKTRWSPISSWLRRLGRFFMPE